MKLYETIIFLKQLTKKKSKNKYLMNIENGARVLLELKRL